MKISDPSTMQESSASLQFWDYHAVTGPARLKNHAHLFWQMSMADSGRACFRCGNREYRFEPWSLVIVPPHCFHEIVYPAGEFRCFTFKFYMRGLAGENHEAVFLEANRETRVFTRMIRTLVEEFCPFRLGADIPVNPDDDYAALLEPLIHAIVIRSYRLRNNQLTLAGQLRQLLIRRRGGPLPVEEAAAHFSYSAGHFSVLIRRETGLAAKQFIDRERARIACHFLEFTYRSVGEVAAGMNFPDALTFCRFFRKQCGVSPGAFHRNIISGGETRERRMVLDRLNMENSGRGQIIHQERITP